MNIYKTAKRLQPLLSCIYLVLQISLLSLPTATAPAPAAREAARSPEGHSASSAAAEATPRHPGEPPTWTR
jgi:hypothetical protein